MIRRRPNGSTQFAIGTALVVVGSLIVVGSFSVHVAQYPSLDVDALTLRWGLVALGSVSLFVALLLFAAGWIIQAISFLPGASDAGQAGELLELTEPAPPEDQPSLTAWLLVGAAIALGLLAVITFA